MTKYILNSGGLMNNIPGAKKFMSEMVKDLGEKPKVLFCFFAQPREVWEERFPVYVNGFSEWCPEDVHPQFELAFPDTFEEQLKQCDVLYIHGGDDQLLQSYMKEFQVPVLWQGKVVATNSASTQLLSKSYWTCDWRECRDGFGVLPIKTLPHYHSDYGSNDPRGPIDWDEAYTRLADYGDKTLPIYALEEGEFEVFEVEE